MKKLFVLITVLLFCLSLAACNKGGKKDDDKVEKQVITIAEMLEKSANNDEVLVEGTIYGVTANGFYIADETSHIFVVTSSANVKAGDKVKFDGKFSYANNFPQVKNVSNLVVEASAQPTLEPVVLDDLSVIDVLDYQKKNDIYGNYYSTIGTIKKDATGLYSLTDDKGCKLFFDINSNTDALAARVGERVTINVMVYKYLISDAKWSLSFTGEKADIVVNALTFDDIIETAKQYVTEVLPTDIYGALTLPKKHAVNTAIFYQWSVDDNPYISISNNKATVTVDEEDHEITLHCNVLYRNEERVVDFKVTSHKITEQSVGAYLANKPVVDFSLIKLTGVVCGFSRNQSLDMRSILLMDKDTKKVVSIDFTKDGAGINYNSDEYKAVKLGDEICVSAASRLSDRPTVMNVTGLEVKQSGVAYEHDFANAIVLDSAAGYDAIGADPYSHSAVLVKFDNPYMKYSTSSTPADTNWVKLGYSVDSVNAGYGETVKRSFAFLIACGNENLGSATWHKSLGLPYSTGAAEQFDLTIYAYCLYISDSYVAFIIPDATCYQVKPYKQVGIDLEKELPASISKGQITLPAAHELVTGAITWESSNPAIIANDGKVTEVEQLTSVTLTATYTVAGQEYHYDINVAVAPIVPLNVSELVVSDADGAEVTVNGVVVAFVSDGNSTESNKGVAIKDFNTNDIILVRELGSKYGKSYPNYVDEAGTTIKVGDSVQVVGEFNKAGNFVGVSSGKLVIKGTASAAIDKENVIVITNNEELAAYAKVAKLGDIVKFVGTDAAQLFARGSASAAPLNYIFHYNASCSKLDNAKYTIADGGLRGFALKSDVNAPNLGENWWVEYAALPVGATNPGNKVMGSFYCVLAYLTSAYYQMSAIEVDEFKLCPTLDRVEEIVKALAPANVEAGADYAIAEGNKVTGPVTWEATPAGIIDLVQGKAAAVTEDKEVTLTATFTYMGEVKEVTKTVKVKAPEAVDNSITVTECLTKDNGAEVEVKGVVVSYSYTSSDAKNNGFVIMDQATGKTILVNNLADKGPKPADMKDCNGADLVVGSEVKVVGTFVKAKGSISALTEDIIITGTAAEINYHLEDAIECNSMADIEKAINDNGVNGYTLKIVATSTNPFYFGTNNAGQNVSAYNTIMFYGAGVSEVSQTQVNGHYLALQPLCIAKESGKTASTLYNKFYCFTAAKPANAIKDGVADATICEMIGVIYVTVSYTASANYVLSPINTASWTLKAA